MRTVIVLVVVVLAFVTVAGLYASGPKYGKSHCPRTTSNTYNDYLHPGASAGTCWRERTNAFERIKGAITGNP